MATVNARGTGLRSFGRPPRLHPARIPATTITKNDAKIPDAGRPAILKKPPDPVPQNRALLTYQPCHGVNGQRQEGLLIRLVWPTTGASARRPAIGGVVNWRRKVADFGRRGTVPAQIVRPIAM